MQTKQQIAAEKKILYKNYIRVKVHHERCFIDFRILQSTVK